MVRVKSPSSEHINLNKENLEVRQLSFKCILRNESNSVWSKYNNYKKIKEQIFHQNGSLLSINLNCAFFTQSKLNTTTLKKKLY